jgi:hypothetical protein
MLYVVQLQRPQSLCTLCKVEISTLAQICAIAFVQFTGAVVGEEAPS